MSYIDKAPHWSKYIFVILLKHGKMMGKPLSEVAAEYPILLKPMPTDLNGMIRYFESADRLFGDLAILHSDPVFESKRNQRKLLVLSYLLKKGSTTSFDVSRDLEMPLTNASKRLRRYLKQALFTRGTLDGRRRGRRTMVYTLTEKGRRRLAFLKRNVKFRRTETYESKSYRICQLTMKKMVMDLRQRWASP